MQPEPSVDSAIQGEDGERMIELEGRVYCIANSLDMVACFSVAFERNNGQRLGYNRSSEKRKERERERKRTKKCTDIHISLS